MNIFASKNVISFVALFDVWFAATEEICSLFLQQTKHNVVEIDTIDVTSEFYNGRPSPLQTPQRFKPLPERPEYIQITYNTTLATATVHWVPGYRAIFLRYYLLKIVNEKEIDGIPMRYTSYLLHGPLPKLSEQTNTRFSYNCINITNTYELRVTVYSLGPLNMDSQHKIFWVNEYSDRTETFRLFTNHDKNLPDEQQDKDSCPCDNHIRIHEVHLNFILFTIHNKGRRLQFEVQIVTSQNTIYKKKTFYTRPKKNVTKKRLNINTRKHKNFKTQVTRICHRPKIRTMCKLNAAGKTVKLFSLERSRNFLTDYFAFL